MLIACRDDIKFAMGENEVFLGKIIINSLGKYFSLLSLLIEFLEVYPASPFSMKTKPEMVYKNMLKWAYMSEGKWNDMLLFKQVPL